MTDMDALYARAADILEGRRNGHALPILRKLALHAYPPGMNMLVDFEDDGRALTLQRRAAASGDANSLYNLAMTYLNRGDLGRYRYWLARAARIDPTVRHELRGFRTRYPHEAMRRLRRLCPAHH